MGSTRRHALQATIASNAIMNQSSVAFSALLVFIALGLQGCGLFGPTKVGTGGCSSLKGASVKHADDMAGCQKICKDTDGCKYFSFCTTEGDCGLFAKSCGIIVNDECELATSLGRDKLTTYKMYDASSTDGKDATGGLGLANVGLLAGLALVAVVGGVVVVRRVRRSAADHMDEGLEGEE